MLLRRHSALLVVLALGVALRLVLLFAYTPAYLSYPDTWGYVKAADGPLFLDDWIRPAGYPMFLAAVHAISSQLTFTIVLQHLLGLATAALAYFTMLRFGAPRWVAVVPAAVIALTMDTVYFEHTLLSEWLFAFLIVAAAYALARSFSEAELSRTAVAWLAGAGLLLAMATFVRTAGLFAVPVFALAALLHPSAGARKRLAWAAVPAAAAVVLLIGLSALQSSQNGYLGLNEGGGWALYSRAAPFADCREFTPPRDARALCETTDARQRGGPDFYSWNEASLARKLYVGPPHNDDVVGGFGRAAITGQPKAYVSAVATDLARFVDPDAGRVREGNGAGPDALDVGRRDPAAERLNESVVEPFYGATTIRAREAVGTLSDLQGIVRVHGVLVLAAVILTLAGLPFANRRERLALLVLGGSAAVMIVLSVASTVYNWRYAVPVLPWLLAAGALGAHLAATPALARVRPSIRGRSRPEAAEA